MAIGTDPAASTSKIAQATLPDGFYSKFLSNAAQTRKASSIRSLFAVEALPGMIPMLVGRPNPATYPFERVTLDVKSPYASGSTTPDSQSDIETIDIVGDDLSEALQYSQSFGVPALNKWLFTLMQQEHGVSQADARVTIGAGSQDLLYKAFTAIVNPGDSIMVEAPTYPGVIPVIDALRCEIVQIDTDSQGISPTSLERTLEEWPLGKPFPKVLYTVPYGANPTGVTTSLVRRLDNLQLARKYNFLIFEDDPYYYLYFGEDQRPASYLSLERTVVDPQQRGIGRVLRFDSLSKIFAAGLRVGWATGPKQILNAMDGHTSTANLQPPTFSQIVALKVLQSWGIPGFRAHVDRVANFYKGKRDAFEKYMQLHLGNGLAEWQTPDAAMFYWVKLNIPETVTCSVRPDTTTAGSDDEDANQGDSKTFVEIKAVDNGVIVLPGTSSFVDGRTTAYVRISFSLLDEAQMDEGLRRLSEALKM
ncbi:TdiD protein [Cylindrobasidium torrendii FP15055 ss-10]|uniref:TdiD protein n=1 Tax=Cylindrobasidium torrendii FP15055 ss-10 TaxID=1314674 RepID=A0A0D7BA61_9AGAR|nr:TdiD protein [Cylindrobasidium torrendii FP15055 ss-10]